MAALPLDGSPVPQPAGPPASAVRRLRVGVVAPPWFEVPPAGYGGIEWICHWLVEGLVSRGHQVTLVAAGTERAGVRFLSTFQRPPSERLGQALPELHHAALADRLLAGLDLDAVHDHSAAGPLTALGRRIPTVVTAHQTTEGESGRYYRAIADRVTLVAICRPQRRRLPELGWAAWSTTASRSPSIPTGSIRTTSPCSWGGWVRQGGAPGHRGGPSRGRALVLAAKCSEPAELAYFEQEIRPQPRWRGHLGRGGRHRDQKRAPGPGSLPAVPGALARAVRDRAGRGAGLRHPGGGPGRRGGHRDPHPRPDRPGHRPAPRPTRAAGPGRPPRPGGLPPAGLAVRRGRDGGRLRSHLRPPGPGSRRANPCQVDPGRDFIAQRAGRAQRTIRTGR